MAEEAASLEFYVGTTFSNVAQVRTSLSIWGWNILRILLDMSLIQLGGKATNQSHCQIEP